LFSTISCVQRLASPLFRERNDMTSKTGLEFKVGDAVVYPAHGVGKVAAIETQEVAGMSLEVYVVTFDHEKMTLRVPTKKAKTAGLRTLAADDTVTKALTTLKGRARVKRTMWSRRAQEYEAKINSGDLISIAEVVRDLHRADTQPEQSYSERQLYESALDRMAREVAAANRIDKDAAVALLARAKAETGGGVEAFELMKRLGMALVLKNIPDTREPLESTPPWYVLIELTSGEPGGADSAMERLLTGAFEEGLIIDAAIAQNDAQKAAFWRLREEHSAGLKPEGGGWKHDVSVPVSQIADFIDEATAAVEKFHPGCRVSVFGHVGDGNLHYDVIPGVSEDVPAFIARWMEGSEIVHDGGARYNGSISAEHGLGRLKTDEARRYKSPLEIATMQAVRQAIDPQRIMNPAVLF